MTSETVRDVLWHEGWYKFAQVLESTNFGPRSGKTPVDLVVIHSISLPPGEFGTGNVQRLFTNTLDWDEHPYFQQIRGDDGLKVSSHFFISRRGELWQFVSADARAWHAGASFYRGRADCNDDSIGIELEGLEGGTFEQAQYQTLIALATAILTQYPVAHIAGHEHISPGRKKDPGPGFDWPMLRRGVPAAEMCWPDGLIN